jgi:ribosomal protein S27E
MTTDPQVGLTPQERQKLSDYLSGRGVRFRCSQCGSNSFSMPGFVHSSLLPRPDKVDAQQSSALLAVECTRCHHLELFAEPPGGFPSLH